MLKKLFNAFKNQQKILRNCLLSQDVGTKNDTLFKLRNPR